MGVCVLPLLVVWRDVVVQVEEIAWVVAALDLYEPAVSAAVVVTSAVLVVSRGEVGV
jgi:hypothetical protein